jgi:CRP-like cAMP-binding protein
MATALASDTRPSCLDCPVRKLTLYRHFGEANFTREPFATRRFVSFRRGQTLLRQGERITTSLSIYSGWAFKARQLGDGRRQILDFLLPGDMAIVPALAQPTASLVKAITAVQACVLQFSEFLRLLQASPFEDFAQTTHLCFNEVARQDEAITNIGQLDATERVANLLLGLERRLREKGLAANGQFAFPLRQEHLADALGLTTVHVNRTLTSLRAKDMITYGGGVMAIDRAALEQILR